MATRNISAQSWTLRRTPDIAGKRRRGLATEAVVPEKFLQSSRLEAVFEADAAPAGAGARRSAPGDLVLDVDVKAGEAALVAIRHASGALTFHPSSDAVQGKRRRGGATAASVARFRIPVRRVEASGGRRGVISQAIKVAVIKVAKAATDKAVSLTLPKLAAAWERQAWKANQLEEGWFVVTPGPDKTLRLTPGAPKAGPRALVFLHGTFSNASSAFGGLASTNFFDHIRPLYGDRIYAFNHFTVSKTPEENMEQLLEGLPPGELEIDVVTHSRGGLVLRALVELGGHPAERVRVRHAVLVASPNDGTPLATPGRWNETVGWFANLIDFLPETPFTTGAAFVSEAIVWLASHLAGDLPGLRAMDRAGQLIGEIQRPPGPPRDTYSALVSNVHPDERLWQRALDVGVDAFFASANDLVVPTEGGWQIDRDGTPHVPPARIGCFGPGGNIPGAIPTHVGFFDRPETAAFIAKALADQPHGLAAIDPDAPLPDRRFSHARRGAVAAAAGDAPRAAAGGGPKAADVPAEAGPTPAPDTDTMHIVIMTMDDAQQTENAKGRGRQPGQEQKEGAEFARIFASYGGARVTARLRLRQGKDRVPTRWGNIITTHEQIKDYTNKAQGDLPGTEAMMAFGSDLFDTLFQGEVRRLYDEARSRQRDQKLDIILTSMIPWIGEKPWEFAYDRVRESFLATEDVHFVRNVLTAIPADPLKDDGKPLRILVASAQPVGFGQLSIEEEEKVIRRGFESLIDQGLVSVKTLPRATPEAIHGHLQTGGYDALHFIGHGEFDDTTQEGYLIFEDDRGGEFRLGRRSVRELFCGRGLSLVFLNACQSGQGGRADFNKGIAQALVQHGLPALVANQYSVLDSSATSFARHFYWSLAQGNSIGSAAREARIAVNYSLTGELIDWAVPVVYAREPNRSICQRRPVASPVPSARVRGGRRGATDARQYRIAVWDIDDVFPAMEQTLARMNGAQNVFGFDLVDMSVPLGVWDVQKRSPDGSPYLWADRLAARLGGKAVELRVNLLCCVTRHWMRDDDTLNIFSWWPTDRKPPVALFSCAGFDMKAQGPDTDRAIANATVAALAGFFGGLDTHTKGTRECPLYYNGERDVKYVTGRLKFDPTCRSLVRKSEIRDALPALEALLKVFP